MIPFAKFITNKFDYSQYVVNHILRPLDKLEKLPPPRHFWRNDITGLRAVAVLPVLFFHAFPNLLPGGFFGVDVFFVISGYLISGIIFRGLIDGTFSYRTFYEKRIKRIIPNLLLLLTFVSIIGYFFLLPAEYSNLGQHIYSSAGFIQNFRLLGEIGYFTEDALRKPLLHLWSLAIEEQFYIVFPIICSLIWYFFKSRTLIGIAVLLIGVCSLEACLLIPDKSFTFYFPLTRFWELGAGIGLAFVESFGYLQVRKMALGLRNILSLFALAAILIPMLFWCESMVHPGWITLIPVLGAVCAIAANPDALVNRTLLCWRPMTFVGLISYSLYLWHWPLLSFLFICLPAQSAFLSVSALALSFVIATTVYFYVENPIRRSDRIGRFSTVLLLASALIVAFVCGYILKKEDGFPDRPSISKIIKAKNIFEYDDWKDYYKLEKIPVKNWRILTQDKNTFPNIIFAGDSHVEQYFRRAIALSEKTGISAGFVTSGGCCIFDSSLNNYKVTRCKKASEAVFELIMDDRVNTIVIGQMWGKYYSHKNFNQFANKFKKAISQRKDLSIYVILDHPWNPEKTPTLKENLDPKAHFNRFTTKFEDTIIAYPKDNAWVKGNETIEKLLGDVATIIPVAPQICPNQKCDIMKWYRDDDHLNPKRLEKDAIWIDQIFNTVSVRGLQSERLNPAH